MNAVDPVKLFHDLIHCGHDVAYLDGDYDRRQRAWGIAKMYGRGDVRSGNLTALGCLHRQITVAVDPHKFNDTRSDWKMISNVNVEVHT